MAGLITFLKNYYWAFLALFAILLFKKAVLSVFLVAFLIVLGILSSLTTRVINYNIGIELVTFVTVVLAYAYNPFVGFMAAMIMVFGSSVLLGRVFCPLTMGRYGTYVVLCVMAALFSGMDVSTGGKILVIAYNLLMWGVYAMIKGFSLFRGAVPVVVNVVLNFFLFTTFAHPLMSALR